MEGGPPCFRRDCTCPAVLTIAHPRHRRVAYGTLTRSGRPFQQRSATSMLAHLVVALPDHPWDRSTPTCQRRQALTTGRFRLLPGRSPLLGESSLFVRVLRCFSSPTALDWSMDSTSRHPAHHRVGLPHSDTLGSRPARGSPRRFVAWPRPSSAHHAQASTVCPSYGRRSPHAPVSGDAAAPRLPSVQMLGVITHLSRCAGAARAPPDDNAGTLPEEVPRHRRRPLAD